MQADQQELFQEVEVEAQEEYVPDQEVEMLLSLQQTREVVKGDQVKNTMEKEQDFLFSTEEAQGDQFMAVKPWKGALCQQQNLPQGNPNTPQINLQLNFINGINTMQMSQMVFYTNAQNQIVYPAACVGVVMDKYQLTQKYFGGVNKNQIKNYHVDDIISLDFHQGKNIVATGSIGKNPDIIVWNPENMEVISKFRQGKNTRAVATIRFSQDAQVIYTTDRSQKTVLHAWSLQGNHLASYNCNTPVFQMATGPNNTVALATKRGCFKFTFTGNGFKKSTVNRSLCLSVCFSEKGKLYLGTSNGNISSSSSKGTKVCNGSIFSMVAKQGQLYASGSKQKSLKVLSQNLEQIASYQLSEYARSIDVKGNQILVALKNGKIQQLDQGNPRTIINGHCAGQVWGLALNSQTGQIITSGDDNKLLVFNKQKKVVTNELIINTKSQKGKMKASTLSTFPGSQQARALAFNPVNKEFAMACNNGQIFVFENTQATQPKICIKPSKDWCEIMRYSPCGEFLAAGYHDQAIYLLSVKNEYQVIHKMKKHSSFLVSIDWSEDSQYLRSVSGAYQLLYFNVQNGDQVTNSPICSWVTQGKFGLATQGIWQQIIDGSFVNTIDRNHARNMLLAGQDDGCLRIYRNPAYPKRCKSYKAHSSHIMKGVWSQDDSYIVTVGGNDKTMMIWNVLQQ